MTMGTIFSPLLADPEYAALFSDAAQVGHWLEFQRALLLAQGVDPAPLNGFVADHAALAEGTLRDGVPIPTLVAQLRAVAPMLAEALHRDATSQDVLDSAMAMTLVAAHERLSAGLTQVGTGLDRLDTAFGSHRLMTRTRMQAALPGTVSGRIDRWRQVVDAAGRKLSAQRDAISVLQYGGAVGQTVAPERAAAMAKALGLRAVPAWHTQRLDLADFAGCLSLLNGALGKIGADIALMAQMGEVTLDGGGSSAMPFKNNPVLAEVLVALARKSAADLSAMHVAVVAEQERSGTSMTLEWLTLPGLVIAAGTALNHCARLVGSIKTMGAPD